MRNRLRVLRSERDWTQAALGARVGVSRQTIVAIETGKYDPGLALAFRISQTFQQPIEAIFIPDTAFTPHAVGAATEQHVTTAR